MNALLSYGYAVLFHNLLTLVAERGLNPYLGSLHAAHDGHPALVSDLMEEFRALVVDTVVLRLLGSDHAWLNAAELRALLAEAAAVIEPAADAVRAYPLALRDRSRRETLGDQPPAPRPAAHWLG